MAVQAKTIETYDNSVIRENLQEDYAMISPEETPYQEMAGRRSVTQPQFDWPVVELAAPDADNLVAEGEGDVENDDGTLAKRIHNYCQISDKAVSVSHTSQASDAAAQNIHRLITQRSLKMRELKRDKEVMLLSNRAAAAASSGNKRITAGLPVFLRTNVEAAAGATAPTLSGTDEGFPDAVWGDGTATRVFAEKTLNDVIERGWTSGAAPSVIMLNGGNKRRLSATFTGNSTRYKDAIDNRLSASIDFYDSDFGDLTVVPNRFQPTLNAASDDDNFAVYVLDPEYLKIAYLDEVQSKPLAETGHAMRELVWCEYGNQVDNEAAHGLITDTDNTTPA